MLDIINVLAIIIIPFAVVFTSRWLQDLSEKRNDKMRVFMAVMTFRMGISRESVEALNSIPIVFSGKKDNEVRICWKNFFTYLCIQNPDEMQIRQKNDALFKLIESMAHNLGYKNTITWEDIQNPYIPVGMANSMNNSEFIQNGMVSVLQNLMANNQNGSNSSKQTDK